MKIKAISVVLMSLVSALAFMSQAQQSKAAGTCSPPCDPNTICVGGICLPIAAPPPNVTNIDPKTCSVFDDKVTCKLNSNSLTMPKEGFEALTK